MQSPPDATDGVYGRFCARMCAFTVCASEPVQWSEMGRLRPHNNDDYLVSIVRIEHTKGFASNNDAPVPIFKIYIHMLYKLFYGTAASVSLFLSSPCAHAGIFQAFRLCILEIYPILRADASRISQVKAAARIHYSSTQRHVLFSNVFDVCFVVARNGRKKKVMMIWCVQSVRTTCRINYVWQIKHKSNGEQLNAPMSQKQCTLIH